MKNNKLIPFSWMPGSWGLRGQIRLEAEAAYYLEGEELDRKIVEIRYSDKPKDLEIENIALDLKYEKIDEYEHDLRVLQANYHDAAELAIEVIHLDLKHEKISEYDHDLAILRTQHIEDTPGYDLAFYELEFKHGHITEIVYQKETSTIRGEPWVGILESGFEPDKGLSGLYFALDWNKRWINKLVESGYSGATEQEIIDRWFSDVCRSQGLDASYSNVVPFGI